jgi:hypothetical protein
LAARPGHCALTHSSGESLASFSNQGGTPEGVGLVRVQDSRAPDEYQRILGLATDEGQRLAEKDPDGFVAFLLADIDSRRKD